MSTRNEHKPDAGEMMDKGKKVDRHYICPGEHSITFYIPIRDPETGKKVPERDARGNPKYTGNTPVFKMDLKKFTPCSAKIQLTDTFKSMCEFTLYANNPQYEDYLEVLERKRLDPSNMVMDTEMYEKWRNPDAAEAVLQNRKLIEENKEKKDVIANMQSQIDSLKSKLEKTGK